ncbi:MULTISPECIES: hypothetical protein [Hymenobacter]|uniref:PH domain-containing protein n=1 Tax=Hymenobacter jejuensis TaxID=2502781 RepID=A0A5B7ZY56_9BACT|nr:MULTISPECIES: hypothetical protein [Hymenobacter]MBC6991414.1 hypothetical protein [Hymenobacter sp. BT491]QDA59749.1 hypothetical protein FHG12_06360 [Hymenobacter jejuensis]
MKFLPFLRPLLEFSFAVLAIILGLRFITSFFSRESKVYRPMFLRQLYLLFWPLLCMGVGLPFLASFVYLGSISSAFELVLLLALASVVLGFSIPALVLHAQYYARNLRTTLVFDPKQNRLEVYEGRVRIPFRQADMVRVERVTCKSRRLFWSNYDYVRLYLRTGEVLTLTSILTNLEPLAEFLRNTNLQHRESWFCFA